MAPKKANAKAAAREKAVEDKTFGLKNKKGAKGQKFVAQVKQSIDATANKGSRGPSKKELKEMQKAQEEEMQALFNIVPKKTDDNAAAQEELDADAGPTFTDITQEIEYQRANVVAKTKITDEVFQQWRAKKTAERKRKADEARADRVKRGILTGWEIFMESATSIVDDATAAGDDDMMREINEEDEIQRMEALSLQAQRDARIAAGMDPGPEPGGKEEEGVTTGTGIKLSAEEQAELFDDDDDDDDVDLDALEQQVATG